MPDPLKLVATEVEDMEVISAALEGLITSPGEMSYLKTIRAFTVVGSRFRWEEPAAHDAASRRWHRIRSGLYIGDVMEVKTNSISKARPREVLELLSLSTHVGEDMETEITFNFAGGGTLRIKAECINVTLTDTGEAWETTRRPNHGAAPLPDQD